MAQAAKKTTQAIDEQVELPDVFMQAPAMIAILRGPRHVFEFANPFYLQVSGRTDRIIGQTIRQVFPELKEQGIYELLDEVYKTGKPYMGNEVHLHLDVTKKGSSNEMYFNFVYQPIRDKAGKVHGIFVHAVDVTDQVRARKKAEEDEQRYSTLLNSIDEGFCIIEVIFDATDKPVDYRFLEVNAVFEKQTGLKDAEGRRVRELVPGLEKHWFELYGKVAKTGKAVRFSEGAEEMGRWFDVYAARIGGPGSHKVALLFTDITKRRNYEQGLQASESYYRKMADNTPVMIWITDPDGKCIYLNKQWYDYTGQTPEEAQGFGWLKAVHPDDAQEAGEVFVGASKKREAYIMEYRLRGADGTYRWMVDKGLPKFDEAGTYEGFIGSVIDIHERKLAEEELRESESRFRNLADTAPMYLAMADETGKAVYFNKPWLEFTGKTLDEMVGFGWLSTLHPEDAPKFEKDFKAAFKKHVPINEQYRFKRADGEYRWMLAVGSPRFTPEGRFIGYYGTYTDFHDLKMAQLKVAESEERFRMVANNISSLVWTLDKNGKPTWYNQRWYDYTGATPADLKKTRGKDLHHPKHRDRVVRKFYHCIENGEVWEDTFPILGKDGKYRWFLSRAIPICDKKGNIVRWFGSNTDIDELRRMARRKTELENITATLKDQRAQLLALNKAQDEFISLASHQLRTPATSVKQYLGMALEGYAGDLDEHQRSFIKTAFTSNERQLQIVNDLLKVARVDSGKIKLKHEKTNIVELVQSILDEQASNFKESNQHVAFTHPKKPVYAMLDKGMARMALENLIDNAHKYTNPDKTITVQITQDKKQIRVSIQDEGVGIDKKDLGSLFTKFSRIDNPLSISVGGTGLGLYWAKRVIDLHGGTIEVESEHNVGSTFTVILPTTDTRD